MPRKRTPLERVLKFFRLNKIATLADLALHLRCSQRTVQRRLEEWHAINSYNQNGRYYTLPDIPKFDVNGLWRYRSAFFSRYGNLPQTLIEVVRNSQAGLTASEVGTLLDLRPSSFLSAFRAHPALRREKYQGLYVYFASDPILYAQQHQRRSMMSKTARLPSDLEAIAVLVEKIKHPQLSIEALCGELAKGKHHVAPETVSNLFTYHGLAGKKTPHSPL